MPSVIQTHRLSKFFGDLAAVRDLDLTVDQGEMFGLVGPDGAGKTTTIRMLCGIFPPSSGTATILGKDLVTDLGHIKNDIGYLSQKFTLYGDLTVDENIEFFAEIHNVRNYRTRREDLLEFTRLTPFRTRLAERLSGGMKQKLALACTLVHRPRVIFLDEPTTGVDPVSRRDFWRILQSILHEGITIVMTTPYLDEAERCTRVALMNAGSVMHADTPAALKRLVQGEVLEIHTHQVQEGYRLLGTRGRRKEVQAFGDRLHVLVRNRETDVESVIGTLRGGNVRVESWRIIQASLENVFISLLTQNEQEKVNL